MVQMLPDRTFYPRRPWREAPAEKLACTSPCSRRDRTARRMATPDAIGVVDVDPASPSTGKLVGRWIFRRAAMSSTISDGTRAARISDLIKRWPRKSVGVHWSRPRSPGALPNKEANMFFAGIDAHTRYVVVVILNNMGERVAGPTRVKVGQPERLLELLAAYRPLEAIMGDQLVVAVVARAARGGGRALRPRACAPAPGDCGGELQTG